MIEAKLKSYLRDRGEEIPEALLDKFAEDCKVALKRQLSPQEDRKFSVRLSQIGKPVCQQQCEKLGVEGEDDEYNLPLKFLMGDLVEAVMMVLLEMSGVKVEDEQDKVEYDGIGGTMDCTLDGKVYDIKSCSSYAFEHKFEAGFHSLLESDTFGYVPQLYSYAEAKGKKAGGWVAMDKTTGKITVCETPIADNFYRKDALKLIKVNVSILEKTKTVADIQPQYKPEEETYYRKPTGEMVLSRTCGYCKFKLQCFPQAELKSSPTSKAKIPPKKWYTT